MKLGPVAKIDKRNKATSKKIDDNVMLRSYDVIAIFQFTDHLEQSESRIPDA